MLGRPGLRFAGGSGAPSLGLPDARAARERPPLRGDPSRSSEETSPHQGLLRTQGATFNLQVSTFNFQPSTDKVYDVIRHFSGARAIQHSHMIAIDFGICAIAQSVSGAAGSFKRQQRRRSPGVHPSCRPEQQHRLIDTRGDLLPVGFTHTVQSLGNVLKPRTRHHAAVFTSFYVRPVVTFDGRIPPTLKERSLPDKVEVLLPGSESPAEAA